MLKVLRRKMETYNDIQCDWQTYLQGFLVLECKKLVYWKRMFVYLQERLAMYSRRLVLSANLVPWKLYLSLGLFITYAILFNTVLVNVTWIQVCMSGVDMCLRCRIHLILISRIHDTTKYVKSSKCNFYSSLIGVY